MRLFDEAETVSIIKKIIGFEKRGSFLNLTLEGYEKVVAAELEIVLDIAKKYGAEDLGTEYGEKWFQNRITFFYPDNIMDLPPDVRHRWIPWRPTTISRRSTGR